ncbi:MAG: hypothetical protein LBB62_01760 [Proteiniphilum sp.]|jgi:hypothetical protein|nr:hypothetical protein [Proteiniphilum sp.]
MQWLHKTGVAGECVFESLYTLEGNVIAMESGDHFKNGVNLQNLSSRENVKKQ